MKLEGELTQRLVKAIRKGLPNSVVFKHSDRVTYGIPDVSVTWLGSTTWLEMKRIAVSGAAIQHARMCQLATQGRAFYVVFQEVGSEVRTPEGKAVFRAATDDDVVRFLRMTHAKHRNSSFSQANAG